MEPSEATPLTTSYRSYQSSNSEYSISDGSEEDQNDDDLSYEEENRLGNDLMKCNNNDELENVMLSKALKVAIHSKSNTPQHTMSHLSISRKEEVKKQRTIFSKMVTLISIALIGVLIIFVLVQVGQLVTGPPSQPVGPYKLVAVQDGEDFFNHYVFYNGEDSEGSKGYINYVEKDVAFELNIANVTYEDKDPSVFGGHNDQIDDPKIAKKKKDDGKEPFVYMATSPTKEGPRNSIRLEGLRRFNRGLFILDVRHMPAGCATWPAFWLTDEPNWPINGEIDILEGVNTQSKAKTALHTTKGCDMNDVPLGVKTGDWDTAVGVPKQNGDLDMTVREARDCYAYDEHQWLNQGCVETEAEDGTLGEPLNKKGGGVFVFEWDPINRFMKSWVFSPHIKVPDNLRMALESANEKESTSKIVPDPRTWGLPYAYYPIGKGTSCSEEHFRNMHLIFNTALCGTVAGNRFFMDCPLLNEKYGNCEDFVKSDPPEMDEVYWKIRGLYIYQREWERAWVGDE
ncbi:hypothetical protein CTEN210_01390 [Chaetoceros tenuissimus]|uniref:GH16 domain-containing protein n=1 Tax=Chaetoceros tenuissimus TaxID=426638 RepID=A0AAD3CHF8_9STRA|nr:hypothetical protein CTEN210_01390 [Chaetoceros tenuissimus]